MNIINVTLIDQINELLCKPLVGGKVTLLRQTLYYTIFSNLIFLPRGNIFLSIESCNAYMILTQ